MFLGEDPEATGEGQLSRYLQSPEQPGACRAEHSKLKSCRKIEIASWPHCAGQRSVLLKADIIAFFSTLLLPRQGFSVLF